MYSYSKYDELFVQYMEDLKHNLEVTQHQIFSRKHTNITRSLEAHKTTTEPDKFF